MATDRENFEYDIDLNGGSFSPFRVDEILGEHSTPLETSPDRLVTSWDSPKDHPFLNRIKSDDPEGPGIFSVYRQEDMRALGQIGLRIVTGEIDKPLSINSIVSRVSLTGRRQEMIWYREEGELKNIIARKDDVRVRYDV